MKIILVFFFPNALYPQPDSSLRSTIEIYDSTTFLDWPNCPQLHEFLLVNQEPIPLNISEILRNIGYPTLVHEAGISLSAVFRILVDKDGSVMRIIGISGFQPWLPELGVQLRKLKFEPALKDGQPVRFWINIPIQICPTKN